MINWFANTVAGHASSKKNKKIILLILQHMVFIMYHKLEIVQAHKADKSLNNDDGDSSDEEQVCI